MSIQNIAHKTYNEKLLANRYICNDHITSILNKLPNLFDVSIIGKSVKQEPIYAVKIGHGKKRVLLWSQMHGNESTTTKAIFDLFNYLASNHAILNQCTLLFIPILNPDGAKAYTRTNANLIDLNRDAQNLSQSESITLDKIFKEFQPNFCFNLHGQRTIFSAGEVNKPATLSFLAPAEDKERTVTQTRKVAMEIIAAINNELQTIIPGQIGVYDDTFNSNCVGDKYQSLGVPTILFEAGHYYNDYNREETRKLIFLSLIVSLNEIAENNNLGTNYKAYLEIPENKKLFYDIIIRRVRAIVNNKEVIVDIAIQYEEVLSGGGIDFIPKVKEIGNLLNHFGHREINAKNGQLIIPKGVALKVENSIDCVTINNVKYSLNLIKS